MMIGKTYYYMDENQQAERKFLELTEGYPNGGLKIEGEIYLAYVRYRMNDHPGARTIARQVLEEAGKEGESWLIARACTVLGQIALEELDYNAAREFYERAGENGESATARVASFIAAAEMYGKQEKYREAEITYARAENESNSYVGEYRGRIGAIRMLAKQGEFEKALRGLEDLRSKSNNREFFGEIDLETGHVERDMGEFASALAQYAMVDTTYPRTETAAKSYFARGELFENVLFRYDSARVAYSKARSEYGQAAITPIAALRADYLTRYLQYTAEIAKYDSLRTAILTTDTLPPPVTRPDSLAPARPGADTVRAVRFVRPTIPLDSVDAHLALNESELAGLFYATIGRPDSAEKWYRRVLVDHPASPSAPRALFTLAQIYSRDTLSSRPLRDSLYHVIVKKFPDSEFAVECRRLLGIPPLKKVTDVAEDSYTRGENLMLAGSPEAAVDTFRQIARRYPSSPYSSRALFAAGWIYENKLDNTDSAIAHYERLTAQYPASPYAIQVRPKLGEVALLRKNQSAPPRTADTAAVPAPRLPGALDGEGVRAHKDAGERMLPGRGAAPDSTNALPRPDARVKPKKPEEKE
jgi:TolA-binding protein